MKGLLLGAALAALGLNAQARDYAYAIAPGLPAVVTVAEPPESRLSARVGGGAEQSLGQLGDEEVDQFQAVDVDRDGYQDFVVGQSGGGAQLIARIFLYRPQDGSFRELAHPGGAASPCRGFVNPVFHDARPAFSVACRYSATDYGFEDYTVCADGTLRATAWSRRSGDSQTRLRLPAQQSGSCSPAPKR